MQAFAIKISKNLATTNRSQSPFSFLFALNFSIWLYALYIKCSAQQFRPYESGSAWMS